MEVVELWKDRSFVWSLRDFVFVRRGRGRDRKIELLAWKPWASGFEVKSLARFTSVFKNLLLFTFFIRYITYCQPGSESSFRSPTYQPTFSKRHVMCRPGSESFCRSPHNLRSFSRSVMSCVDLAVTLSVDVRTTHRLSSDSQVPFSFRTFPFLIASTESPLWIKIKHDTFWQQSFLFLRVGKTSAICSVKWLGKIPLALENHQIEPSQVKTEIKRRGQQSQDMTNTTRLAPDLRFAFFFLLELSCGFLYLPYTFSVLFKHQVIRCSIMSSIL